MSRKRVGEGAYDGRSLTGRKKIIFGEEEELYVTPLLAKDIYPVNR
jgi:hypothetical protein